MANKPVAAWIGRIEDNKNWREFLLIGMDLIRYYDPNLQLYMFEDPTLANPVERLQFMSMIEQLDIKNNLTLHANVPNMEMRKFLSYIGDSGGFLCSTSKVEGAPYAILEAMELSMPWADHHSMVSSSVFHNITGKYYRSSEYQCAFD